MEEIIRRLKQMSNAAASTNEPLSWFEELYSSARGDDNWIPWSDGSPSPFVVEWAKKRHEKGGIEWVVADLLNPPDEWRGEFELVLEVHILQAIPENIRNNAARKLPLFVAKGGHLVCIGRFDDNGSPHEGPPWPLNQVFIESIGESLGQMSMVKATLPNDEPSTTRYRATWSRPDY